MEQSLLRDHQLQVVTRAGVSPQRPLKPGETQCGETSPDSIGPSPSTHVGEINMSASIGRSTSHASCRPTCYTLARSSSDRQSKSSMGLPLIGLRPLRIRTRPGLRWRADGQQQLPLRAFDTLTNLCPSVSGVSRTALERPNNGSPACSRNRR